MVSKVIVKEIALDFLKAVAKVAEAQLGRHPKRLQRSIWMVPTGPSSRQSKTFNRKVFNRIAASNLCQTIFIDSDFPQQRRLKEILVMVGIQPEEVQYGFLLPLVHHWLELPDPFAFDESAVSQVIDEFTDAVIEGVVLTRSRDVIILLDLASGPISLEKGVSIRTVNEEELWELGDADSLWTFLPLPGVMGTMPGEDWKILDIQLQHVREEVHPPRAIEVIRESALFALSLASSGHLRIFDLGRKANYGVGAVGTVRAGEPMPRQIGRGGGSYVLDAEVAQRLKELWPRLRKIIASKRHYLRIPAQRLVDGGGRIRADDAIVDYAIGLEALLMKEASAELRYRFALRGATILAWNSGDKGQLFNELRNFYGIRSKIVHGENIDQAELTGARSFGEKTLRGIWWWYFNSGGSLSGVISKVDHRILE